MRAFGALGSLVLVALSASCALDRTGLDGESTSSSGGAGGDGGGGMGGGGDGGTGATASCGNGLIETNEACDDGGVLPDDGCSPACQIDDGFSCSGSPSVCAPVCGDGVRVGIESCDDGGTTPDDGCSADCAVEEGFQCYGEPSVCSSCGDGQITGLEDCEDGNLDADDGCNAVCRLEATCGNSIKEPGEQCDDGPGPNGDGCSGACLVDAGVCLDAIDLSDDTLPAVTITGSLTSVTGDTTGSTLTTFGALGACVGGNKATGVPIVLHRYEVGPAPAVLNAQTVNVGGLLTDTVLSMYDDCLTEELVACNDDINVSKYSGFRSGVLPARSVVYFAVTGYTATDIGPYQLDIVEERVILEERFDTGLGLFQVEDFSNDGRSFAYCDPGLGCAANNTQSASGGGYAICSDNPDADLETERLVSPKLSALGQTNVRLQYAFDFNHQPGAGDSARVEVSTDMATWSPVAVYDSNDASGVPLIDISAFVAQAPEFWVRFQYDDGGVDASTFGVDDIKVIVY
jgi:cysteine-rich repeat protein